MIYLILSILSSTSIALILKLNSHKKGSELLLIAGNYLTASVISLIFILFDYHSTFSLTSILMGSLIGIFFFLTFILFAKSIKVAGMALATVSSRLSVAVAILLSILFFSEIPEFNDYLGFFFSIVTIILFAQSLSKTEKKLAIRDYLYLIGLLVGIGMNDFLIKVFEETRPVSDKNIFIFSIFFSAMLYSFIYLFYKKEPCDKSSFLRGLILGIPNVLSTIFFLLALGTLKAIIVFPVNNVGVILLSTIIAITVFKEKTCRKTILSIITGLAAIVFLSL